MAGTGKVEHEEDELNGGRVRREDLGDPGKRLGVAEIRTLLQATPQSVTAVDEKQNAITNRINSAMAVVRRRRTVGGGGLDQLLECKWYHVKILTGAPCPIALESGLLSL